MKITFPNGDTREFADGSTGMEIAYLISDRLAKEALGIFNGEKYNLQKNQQGRHYRDHHIQPQFLTARRYSGTPRPTLWPRQFRTSTPASNSASDRQSRMASITILTCRATLTMPAPSRTCRQSRQRFGRFRTG